MRAALLLVVLALAGCAAEDAAPTPERWTFTQRNTLEDARPLGESEGFAVVRNLSAEPNVRQIGGQWHGALAKETPLVLSFVASAPMAVEFRVSGEGAASASGRCDWGENATDEKALGIARVRMRSTETTCDIFLTPTMLVDAEAPTLRWEARSASAEPAGWSLRFMAGR